MRDSKAIELPEMNRTPVIRDLDLLSEDALILKIMEFLEPTDQLTFSHTARRYLALSQKTALPHWVLIQLLKKEDTRNRAVQTLLKNLTAWSDSGEFHAGVDLGCVCLKGFCCLPVSIGMSVLFTAGFVDILQGIIVHGASTGPVIGSVIFGGFSLGSIVSAALPFYGLARYCIAKNQYHAAMRKLESEKLEHQISEAAQSYSENHFRFLNRRPELQRIPLMHSMWSWRQHIIDGDLNAGVRVRVEEVPAVEDEEGRLLNQASSSYQTFS